MSAAEARAASAAICFGTATLATSWCAPDMEEMPDRGATSVPARNTPSTAKLSTSLRQTVRLRRAGICVLEVVGAERAAVRIVGPRQGAFSSRLIVCFLNVFLGSAT